MMSNTQLKNYTLWYDGDITVSSSLIDQFITYGPHVKCDILNQDIKQYNKMVSKDEQIVCKQQCDIPKVDWTIPQKYTKLDLLSFIKDKHEQLSKKFKWNDHQRKIRNDRIDKEYQLIVKNKLISLIQTLIYIVDNLTKHSIVWGPGRGSSVSSYILYILQVHDVDSVLYELDISDFLQ